MNVFVSFFCSIGVVYVEDGFDGVNKLQNVEFELEEGGWCGGDWDMGGRSC